VKLSVDAIGGGTIVCRRAVLMPEQKALVRIWITVSGSLIKDGVKKKNAGITRII
jgi:hypothetical protein